MRSVHILHHSISPFQGQFPEDDPLHYNTGIPMLFARAIRSRHPASEVEVWRPERTLDRSYTWQDQHQVTHRIFPSRYVRYKLEFSLQLLRAVQRLVAWGDTYIWLHGIYNLHAYLLSSVVQSTTAIAQSHGGFPARALSQVSRHRWLRHLYLPMHPIEKAAFARYPHILALSSEENEYLQRMLSVPPSKITLSPTGIDFDHFNPGDQPTVRRACGLRDGVPTILYVGRLSQEKGVRYLIEALPAVAARVPRAELFVVGTGPLRPELEDQVASRDLDRRVHFVGYVDPEDLPRWYRAADVTVLPSLIDWFPKVAMESMACGTPIVIFEGGGAADIVREFECGVLVPLRDTDKLAEATADTLLGGVPTQPNVERGRQAFDWASKLSTAFDIFETLSDART